LEKERCKTKGEGKIEKASPARSYIPETPYMKAMGHELNKSKHVAAWHTDKKREGEERARRGRGRVRMTTDDRKTNLTTQRMQTSK